MEATLRMMTSVSMGRVLIDRARSVALLCIAATACQDSELPDAGTAGPVSTEALELRSLDGTLHRPMPGPAGEPTVLLFTSSDCPVANGYAPEIRALRSDYVDRGVRFFLVNVESGTPLSELVQHAADYDLPGPILVDSDQALAGRVGAEVTPEAFVVRPGGEVAYRGRIDDRYRELSVRRPAATRTELRDALDSVLAGQPVAVPRTRAVGCLIGDWSE